MDLRCFGTKNGEMVEFCRMASTRQWDLLDQRQSWIREKHFDELCLAEPADTHSFEIMGRI